MIPKLIIQTGPPDLPLILKSATVATRLLHPNFKYLFFGDTEADAFVQQHFPQYEDAYHSFRFRIQKYDFFRYLAIYHYGGFYLDLDVFLAEDLTQLLEHSCVFPFEELTPIRYFWDEFGMDWQIGNYAFGAEAGHPCLAAIIDNCIRAKENPSWVTPMMKGLPKLFQDQYYVTNTTGPGLVSRTLAENAAFADLVTVLFPPDVRDPSTWHQFGTIGVHQMASSWRSRQNLPTRLFRRTWEAWTFNRLLAKTRTTEKTRSLGEPTNLQYQAPIVPSKV